MRYPLLLALLALPACADELDDVRKALEDLSARDGYVLAADWDLKASDLEKTVKGRVKSTVRQKEDFLRLDATFEDGEVTVFRRGTAIAGLNPETKAWESIASDARAKFVLEMFDLRRFLTKALEMATTGEPFAAGENIGVKFRVDEAKLLKLLGEADAGKALVGAKFLNAKMEVRVEMARGTREIRKLEVSLEGDAQGEALKKDPEGAEEIPEWGEEDKQPKKQPEDGKKEPEPAKVPPIKRVNVEIRATPSFRADFTIEVPESAKKVLGS